MHKTCIIRLHAYCIINIHYVAKWNMLFDGWHDCGEWFQSAKVWITTEDDALSFHVG